MKNNLQTYQKKRNFNNTKEPFGKKEKSTEKLRFVIQHHIARKDHYDLRLEFQGVLKSWAVPKGPSFNPKDKRLAILVEDHPLEYRHFEGTIPEGEYGAGTVMLFDEGYYTSIGNFKNNMENGIIKFTLKGKRLKGNWSLIHTKENHWLLIKEYDKYCQDLDLNKYKTSIRTKRTMDEITKGKKINTKHTVEGIKITNPEKLIYEKPNITKMEVIKYYQKIAKRMMPFLENRIISTVRCPDGIKNECFFKKHIEKESAGISIIELKNKENKLEKYYYIYSIEGLINEVQMNSIEFHIWGSKVNDLENPDMLVFDLDPDELLSLKKLRQGVKDLKSILDELKLKSFLKTSGGKGYHVVVPINNINWEDFRLIAKNIAVLMESKWPEKYTSNIRKNKRKNKIFIDWVRNTRGATSVAPYSLRARNKAPVSMPISWEELDKIKPNEITIKEALKRINKKDPWQDFYN